jgi:seryl-tRNA synthetase
MTIDEFKVFYKEIEGKIGDAQTEIQKAENLMHELNSESTKYEELFAMLEAAEEQLQDFLSELAYTTYDELFPPRDPEEDEEDSDDDDDSDDDEESEEETAAKG